MWEDDTVFIKIIGIIVLLACIKIMTQPHTHPEYERECPICVETLPDIGE